MKTINKILWGFISTVICILYRTDVKALTHYPYYSGYLYTTINGVQVFARKTSTRCYETVKPYLNDNASVIAIISTALNDRLITANRICDNYQYVGRCNGVPAYLSTADCSKPSKIICSTCPKLNGYGSTINALNAYRIPSRDIPTSIATGCMDIDNTYSYIVNFYVASQIIVDANSATDCFVPSLAVHQDDAGTYEFTNSCYYTEQ